MTSARRRSNVDILKHSTRDLFCVRHTLDQCWPNVVTPTPTDDQPYNHLPTLGQCKHAIWVVTEKENQNPSLPGAGSVADMDLEDIASVFDADFDLQSVDNENMANDPNLNEILCGLTESSTCNSNSKTLVQTQNQVANTNTSARGLFAFNPRFADQCTVTININLGNNAK